MDKLLPIFNFLKTNRFWLTCGLIAGTMIGIWFMATGQLAQATSRSASDITSKISSANGVIKTTSTGLEEESVVAHPNESTIKGMEGEIEEATKSVIDAWQMRYDSQRDLLKWPADVVAYDSFKSAMLRFNPPETFPVGTNPESMRDILRTYKEHIPNRMESICQIIGTEWKFAEKKDADVTARNGRGAGGRGAGGRGGQGEGRDEPGGRGDMGDISGGRGGRGSGGRGGGGRNSIGTGIDSNDISIVVQWDEANQELWNEKLTQFKGFDDNQLKFNYPTPLQVYMLQQDLWLMEAMFNIIRDVNKSANANDLAKIKRIDHLVFGREARAQLGEIKQADAVRGAAAAPAAGGLGSRSRRPSKDKNKRRGRGGRGGGPQDGNDPLAGVLDAHNSPFHGRYVNELYEPLTGDDIRKVLDPALTELPDNNLEVAVARRVPVRIAVRMDERAIPEFLAASARSAFAFEVNQVRLNKHIAGDGIVRVGQRSGTGRSSGGDDEGPSRGDSISMGGQPGGGGSALDGGGVPAKPGGGTNADDVDGPVETRTHFNVNVEFYGIVKIYNPVNRKLLTGEDDVAATEEAPEPEAAPAPDAVQEPEAAAEPAADSNP